MLAAVFFSSGTSTAAGTRSHPDFGGDDDRTTHPDFDHFTPYAGSYEIVNGTGTASSTDAAFVAIGAVTDAKNQITSILVDGQSTAVKILAKAGGAITTVGIGGVQVMGAIKNEDDVGAVLAEIGGSTVGSTDGPMVGVALAAAFSATPAGWVVGVAAVVGAVGGGALGGQLAGFAYENFGSNFGNADVSDWSENFDFNPVIIDLDGDGIEISYGATASFDMDGDGFRERTTWAHADDGFLVIDLDADGKRDKGDGKIELARELVLSTWGEEGDTDLQALARAFDHNKDGVLDSKDAMWQELRIWQDRDQDGVTDHGELRTLDARRPVRSSRRFFGSTAFRATPSSRAGDRALRQVRMS